MKISSYDGKKLIATIEWRGKTRILSEEAVKKAGYDILKDLPEDKIDELLDSSEETLCYAYLLTHISQYFKTAKGYYDKLVEKGYSRRAARLAIDRAKENGYIDDENFARRYMENYAGKKGYYKLKNDLLAKGIAAETVNAALETLPPLDDEILVLAKKLSKTPPETPQERDKLFRKLASRGFTYDEIKRAIAAITNDEFFD